MRETEDFVILKPYVPSEKEQKAIDELKVSGLLPKDWNSQKKGIVSFKQNIKDYLLDEQNSYCAYCRNKLNEGCDSIQRDHIVPKVLHPSWIFEPRNICLTCYKCNIYKKDKEVLVNSAISTYPIDSNSFKILNPYIDTYSEHIRILNDLVYIGLTNKGRFTINICKLTRIELVLNNAKQKMERDNPNSVYTLLLSSLDKTEISQKEKNEIIERMGNIVQKYKRVVGVFVNEE